MQSRQRNPFTTVLLIVCILCSMTACTKRKIRKINRMLEKEKWEKAQKKSDKLLEKKHDSPKWGATVELVHQQTLYHSILQDPSVPRFYAYLKNYPTSKYASDVEERLYQLLLDSPVNPEAVLLGYFRTSPNNDLSTDFFAAAETVAWNNVTTDPSAKKLHSFLLRYPNGINSAQAKSMEADLAFTEAQSKNDIPTWSEFIRNYPHHPKLTEAKMKLRQVEWAALSTASTPTELWEYAERFKESDEGWLSAVTAYSQGIFTTQDSTGHDILLNQDSILDEPFQNFTFNFQGKLPVGFKSTISTEVNINGEWQTWNKALSHWSKQLQVPSLPSEVEEYEQALTQNGWHSDFGVCSLNAEPTPVRLCGTLSYQEEHQHCIEIQVNTQCRGAQQMIFSTYEDDIVGPIGGLQYNILDQKWDPIVVGSSIPEQWTCTHIYENGPSGVKIVCGEFLMHIGWLENSFAVQASPENLNQIDRISLEPWTNDANKPFILSDNQLFDAQKKLIYNAGDRTIQLSPIVAKNAFKSRAIPFSLQNAKEKIRSNSRILPEDSSETAMNTANYESTKLFEHALTKFVQQTPVTAFARDVRLVGNEWSTASLLLTEPTPFVVLRYQDDWVHFIQIPLFTGSISEEFYTFEKDGRTYLRLFGQDDANQIRLISISIPDTEIVVELQELTME